MRGRKPKPTALKKLQGNPGKRKLEENLEPKPDAEIPTAPEHLDALARDEWDRVTPQLHKLGLLTAIDRAALAAYCQAWSRWVKAETELEKLGEIVKSPSGYPIQNPWLAIANKAMNQLKVFAAEFGLTPSARTRTRVKPPEAKTDSAELRLFGG